MGVLVVGSVALDSVKTPFGDAQEALGGSATYFSVAAAYFTDVALNGTAVPRSAPSSAAPTTPAPVAAPGPLRHARSRLGRTTAPGAVGCRTGPRSARSALRAKVASLRRPVLPRPRLDVVPGPGAAGGGRFPERASQVRPEGPERAEW